MYHQLSFTIHLKFTKNENILALASFAALDDNECPIQRAFIVISE